MDRRRKAASLGITLLCPHLPFVPLHLTKEKVLTGVGSPVKWAAGIHALPWSMPGPHISILRRRMLMKACQVLVPRYSLPMLTL